MDFDSIIGPPKERKPKREKNNKSKDKTKDNKGGKKRIGSFFSRKDKKNLNTSSNNNILSPPTKVQPSTSNKTINSTTPKRTSAKVITDINNETHQSDIILEEQYMYQLRKHYEDLHDTKRRIKQLNNYSRESTIKEIINYCTQHKDPLLNQQTYNPNPFHNKDFIKTNNITKKVDKQLDLDKKKCIAQRDSFTIFTVIAGCSYGQGKFWHGVDIMTPPADVVLKYRRPFAFAIGEIMSRGIHSLFNFNELNALSNDKKRRAEQLLDSANMIRTIPDIMPILQDMYILWKDDIIKGIIYEILSLHPKREIYTQLFERLEIIIADKYTPTLLDYNLLTHFTTKAEAAIKVSNLNFKLSGLDRYHGNITKYISYFSDADVFVFWADLSTPSLAKQYFVELLSICDNMTHPRLCSFVFFTGVEQLKRIGQTEDLTQHFQGYKEGDVIDFLTNKFHHILVNKVIGIPTYKVYVEIVGKEFDVNIILQKTQEVIRSTEQERVLDLAL